MGIHYKLMHKLSQTVDNVNVVKPKCELLTRPKVKKKMYITDKEWVARSPYYKRNQLWDQLGWEIQSMKSMNEFTKKLRMLKLEELKVKVVKGDI